MKPLLLGMNNPLSDDPEFDLYPYPEGSAGWRLWQILPGDISRAEYLQMFDRLNLLHVRTWNAHVAKSAAAALLPTLVGRRVIVLGTEVRAALVLPKTEPMLWHEPSPACSFAWAALPHPSGRNFWYNDVANKAAAAAFLGSLVEAVP